MSKSKNQLEEARVAAVKTVLCPRFSRDDVAFEHAWVLSNILKKLSIALEIRKMQAFVDVSKCRGNMSTKEADKNRFKAGAGG